MKKILVFLMVVCFGLGSLGCQFLSLAATATPRPTATETLRPTATETLRPTPTLRPTLTATATRPAGVDVEEAISLAVSCRSSMDSLHELRDDLGLPEHYVSGDPLRGPGEFDPNSYFLVWSHLSMAEEYTLDYVYFGDELGGRPMLYARPVTQAAYETYDDFLGGIGASYSGERSYDILPYAFYYLDYIRVDDTPESFFEFLSLALLGDQYYLFWHGLYHDEILLCDDSDLAYVDAAMGAFDLIFPAEVAGQVPNLDLAPAVIVSDFEVLVRIVWFTKWGGFLEAVYIMDRQNPALLLDVQVTPLIEYNCGIYF
ncbi:MAG: hypothetical protein JXB85_17480 [Anaerolineales bacterium]|nr:hypothetical protein [Anaerolineales bacterium]